MQALQKPYVIVFCGVNGVGKSTNLAKIAYWLGQHNIKVTIAACDTFRAGKSASYHRWLPLSWHVAWCHHTPWHALSSSQRT